jgi:hypothetical protein
MKIKSKEIKECDDWNCKTIVLDLLYSYKWKEWRILVRDYIDSDHQNILKQLRVKVKENYILNK